jgi:hypothetical protein
MRAALLLGLKPPLNKKESCIEVICKHPFDDKEAVDLINQYRSSIKEPLNKPIQTNIIQSNVSDIANQTTALLGESGIQSNPHEIQQQFDELNTKQFEKVLKHNVQNA